MSQASSHGVMGHTVVLAEDGPRPKRDIWNRCQECGRLIGFDDLLTGKAVHRLLEPDSHIGVEKWETLCRDHAALKEKADG